jgi:hypothetical protein
MSIDQTRSPGSHGRPPLQDAQSQAPVSCDVLVLGAGAGGLSAAITGRWHGLDVLVVEKEDRFGGTTAVSGGGLWIPCNPLAVEAGVRDDLESARAYIQQHSGYRVDPELIDAYLREAPRMVEFFRRHTSVDFTLSPSPDYHSEITGGVMGGRTINAVPFDARELGTARDKIAPPLRELTFLGMSIARGDLQKFFDFTRSLPAAAFVVKRLARHLGDVLFYGRSVRLLMGNALAGLLVKSAIDAGVELWTGARAIRLDTVDGSVRGATVVKDGRPCVITARLGVILACGGFAHSLDRQKVLFPHVRSGHRHWSPSPAGNSGDGLDLGEAVGGQISADHANAGYWSPISRVPRKDNTVGIFPQTGLDRCKPGYIAVTRSGRRFVNEAAIYLEFAEAMLRNAEKDREPEAFLICDHRAIRRYGLGAARPFPVPLRPHLRSRYIVKASSIADLARSLGVDSDALVRTVSDFNTNASHGRDPQFHKGTNPYDRILGDPTHRPNPCLGPLTHPPYYAVRLLVGDVGTLAGLKTDRYARVLGKSGAPLPGLYAVGADMASIFAGYSPGAGITLGPAMTFGYVAAHHIAQSASVIRERINEG